MNVLPDALFSACRTATSGLAQAYKKCVHSREGEIRTPLGDSDSDSATIQMHRMSSRLCSLLNKKLFTQTLLGADLHHFIIHKPVFWQPNKNILQCVYNAESMGKITLSTMGSWANIHGFNIQVWCDVQGPGTNTFAYDSLTCKWIV